MILVGGCLLTAVRLKVRGMTRLYVVASSSTVVPESCGEVSVVGVTLTPKRVTSGYALRGRVGKAVEINNIYDLTSLRGRMI